MSQNVNFITNFPLSRQIRFWTPKCNSWLMGQFDIKISFSEVLKRSLPSKNGRYIFWWNCSQNIQKLHFQDTFCLKNMKLHEKVTFWSKTRLPPQLDHFWWSCFSRKYIIRCHAFLTWEGIDFGWVNEICREGVILTWKYHLTNFWCGTRWEHDGTIRGPQLEQFLKKFYFHVKLHLTVKQIKFLVNIIFTTRVESKHETSEKVTF